MRFSSFTMALARVAASFSFGAMMIPQRQVRDTRPEPVKARGHDHRKSLRGRGYGAQSIILDRSSSIRKFQRSGTAMQITDKMIRRHLHPRHKR